MNILFCSVGRRCELLKDFKRTLGESVKIVVTDNSEVAPAFHFADVRYTVPLIKEDNYIEVILDICKKEEIQAITTLIDPEIMLLAANRDKFNKIGVEVLCPYEETAKLCFDKYEMFKYLTKCGVKTVPTYGTVEEFEEGFKDGIIEFPVFVKPRRGSGSVGAHPIYDLESLKDAFRQDDSLIIQKLMEGKDMDADIYVDTISHEPVAIFSKKKLSTTIGGANKTVSFKDVKLFDFVKDALKNFEFNGPMDMDLFYEDGEYYLSEVNPRFGGAYLHAYGAGVDFVKLIEKNISGVANDSIIGEYEEDVVMMMYDSVVITKLADIKESIKDRY